MRRWVLLLLVFLVPALVSAQSLTTYVRLEDYGLPHGYLFLSETVALKFHPREVSPFFVYTADIGSCNPINIANYLKDLRFNPASLIDRTVLCSDGRFSVLFYSYTHSIPDTYYQRDRYLVYSVLTTKIGGFIEKNEYMVKDGYWRNPVDVPFSISTPYGMIIGSFRALPVASSGFCELITPFGSMIGDNPGSCDFLAEEHVSVPKGFSGRWISLSRLSFRDLNVVEVVLPDDYVQNRYFFLVKDVYVPTTAGRDRVIEWNGEEYLLSSTVSAYETMLADYNWITVRAIKKPEESAQASRYINMIFGGISGLSGYIDVTELMNEFPIPLGTGLGIFAMSTAITFVVLKLTYDYVRSRDPKLLPLYWFAVLMFGDIGALAVAALAFVMG